jgi:hypothetical protein
MCSIPIEVKQIEVGSRNRQGIFLLEDAKEGDLIFEIKQPLLCIVSFTSITASSLENMARMLDLARVGCDNFLIDNYR